MRHVHVSHVTTAIATTNQVASPSRLAVGIPKALRAAGEVFFPPSLFTGDLFP